MSNTIPANNNTSLYNSTGNAIPTNGNISAENINASGNVTVGGYIVANGSITTSSNFVGNLIGNVTGNLTGNVTGNITLTGGNTEVIYNNSGVTGSSPAFTFNQATNVVTAGGNVSASYFIGNGSQLTGLPATYSNANVTTLLAAFGSNTVSTTGNITAGYVFGNGSQLTGLPATYGNANVSAFLPTYTGNITANIISTTGNIVSAANLVTSGVSGNIVGPNYVSANYFVGDGSQLTNLPAGTLAGNLTGNLLGNGFGANAFSFVSATGNITGNYILGNGSQLTGITANYSNANVTSLMVAFGSNAISTTGNVTAGYFAGNGSLLTSLTGANVTGTVANATFATSAGTATSATTAGTVTSNAQANITTVGTLSSLSVSGNITSGGNVNTATVQATGSGGLAFKNSGGTTQASLGAGGGDNFAINVSTNLNGNNAQIDISPTGTGHVHINPTGTGAVEIAPTSTGSINNMVLGNTTPRAANVTTLGTTGNITAAGILTDGYYYANGSPFSGGGGTYGNANVNTLLAAWGSNALSTTGNVTAGYVKGDGSQLTNLPAGNYSNANVNSLLAAWGSNSLSTTGNVSTGNVITTNILMTGQISNPVGDNIAIENITTGIISATGNITGLYIKGDGSQLTGGYSNPNVATFLNAFGSNSIITTGNIGNVTSKVGTGFFNTVATDNINSPTGDFVTIENVSTTAISATGNIQGSYFLGNGSALTGITATANAAGSNTQIQYNNGGATAGNAAMTFNNTTGNITLGNIVINTNQVDTVSQIDLANATAFGTTTAWRVLMGDAYNGSANSIYSSTNPGTLGSPTVTPRLLLADFVSLPNTGLRFQEQTNYVWANLSANISNISTRLNVNRNELTVGGGTSAFSVTAANVPSLFLGSSNQVNLGAGTNTNQSLIGNITTTAGAMGSFNGITVNNYSSANIIVGQQTQLTTNNANASVFGNATTQVGHVIVFTGAPANANITGTTTAIGYYLPGPTATISGASSFTTANIARMASDYYSFRSDDTLAKAQLGSLSSFNEFTGNITSSGGSLTVDKSVAQVQQVYTTEAITTITFSNFITRVLKPNATYANQSDTVTLIVQQGATPYAITMPTGTAYRYAGGVSAVTATANTTVMISVTGTYNYNTAAVQYLITISPAFS